MFRPDRIISGGQTGADLGGLVGARRIGIETGGTAPRGYKTEKGSQVDALKAFGLIEHPSHQYRDRTLQNVKDADATLIVATDHSSGGTLLTVTCCENCGKSYLLVDPHVPSALELVRQFIERERPRTLNIAGNRESKSPGLTAATARLIEQVFATAESNSGIE